MSLSPNLDAKLRAMLVDQRKVAGMTQKEVAQWLRRSRSHIGKLESGARGVYLVEFMALAEAMNFDPADFVNRLKKEAGVILPSTRSRRTKQKGASSK